MWLSLAELKKFYEVAGLTPDSPDISQQISKLRKNVNKQPVEVRSVLENVDAHIVKLLVEIYREYSSIRISWYKNEKNSEYFDIMRYFSIDRDEFYNYVLESYRLALPLCDHTLINLKDVNTIMIDLKQNPSLSKDNRNNFSGNLNFMKLVLSATKKLDLLKENVAKKNSDDHNLKLLISFLLKELASYDNELLWRYLPFCYVISKYLEVKTDTLQKASLSAWKLFIRQPLGVEGSNNILTLLEFLEGALLETCDLDASIEDPNTDSPFDRIIDMIRQDSELLRGIQNRLSESFRMLEPLFLFLKVISEQSIEDEAYYIEAKIQTLKNDIPKLVQALKQSSRSSSQKLKADIKQYSYGLTTLDLYTPLEKKLYSIYLEKFYHQGIDIFYKHTLVDLFNVDEKDKDRLSLTDHHLFKPLLYCI